MNALVSRLRQGLYVAGWEAKGLTEPFGLRAAIRSVRESERWPRARLDELRDRKLRTLVTRLYGAIPAYRRDMDALGVRPADIGGVADIGKLPILTKDRLRDAFDQLRAGDLPAEAIEETRTGGTSGVPMRVQRDKKGTVWQRACYWRGFGWGGLELGAPWVQLFGGSLGLSQVRSLNGFKNWIAGKVFLPAFELGAHNVADYVKAIRRGGARHMVGYASACHELARLVERAGLSLPLDAVFPTSELVLPEWAATMTRVFGAKVLPYYGSGEVQSLGYSCPEANDGTYHTCDEHAVLEVQRKDGSVGTTGEGALLVTDLDNHAMPLVRYKNGDAVVLADAGCVCGRTLARILRIEGRLNDLLVTCAGDRLPGLIAPHVFRSFPTVEAYQIVQRRPGHALIKIVRGAGYDAGVEEGRLGGVFRDTLGAAAEVEFEYVGTIPKTAAGKVRVVVNEFLAAS